MKDKLDICKWREKIKNSWSMECFSHSGKIIDGSPYAEIRSFRWRFKFCPYCGRKIRYIRKYIKKTGQNT